MNLKCCLMVAATGWALAAGAQTTAFLYQGQLVNSNTAVTGNYDLRFQLLNTNASPVSAFVTNAPVGVTNGLFATLVDFGATPYTGTPLWLQLGVRVFGSNIAYTVLSPSQPLTPTPYAIQAYNALVAQRLSGPVATTNLTGTLPAGNLPANVALLNASQTFSATNFFNGSLIATNTSNSFAGTFSGNGAGLTAVSATSLTGILPVGNLPTNVALLNVNQTFGGSNVFSGPVTALNASNTFAGAFSGNGTGLTGVPAANLSGTLRDATLSANVPLFSANDNFSNTVTAVQFNGSGYGLTNVPGAFFWQTVNGTNATASSNLGFITTNNNYPVFITLPANPGRGDTFRVAGVGQAGWVLLQNPGQSVLAANLAGTAGVTWYPSASGLQPWSCLSSSADGTKLVAGVGGVGKTGYIYYSTNAGLTWAQSTSPQNYWSALASSADGSKVVATVGTTGSGGSSGYIFISINYGASWTQANGAAQWDSCASSADGSKLVAVSYNGYIATSVNGGTSWNYSTPLGTVNFTGVASSQDGTKLAACGQTSGGYVYTSVNGGTNWTQQPGSGLHAWSAIVSSGDGSRLVATTTTTTGGGIFSSPDGGVTWSQQYQNPVNWTSVASSADGSHLLAGYDGGTLTTPGYLYGSGDSGLTWTQRSATNAPWIAVASSADGSKLAAAAYNGYIYTSGQNVSSPGTNGYLVGTYQSALELQYVGNGVFLPLSHEGTIRAH